MATPTGDGSSGQAKPAFALTADDLIRLFNDPNGEELRQYDIKKAAKANSFFGKTLDLFCMEPPFDAIKAFMDNVQQEIFQNFDGDASERPRFEHVGSTSIKGMPGTLCPDAMVIEKAFPPSASTIRAIMAAGFKFGSVAPQGQNDYCFFRMIPADDVGGERYMVLHLVDEANPTGRVIRRLRDACNNDPGAFEEYKASKLAARGVAGSAIDYKIRKVHHPGTDIDSPAGLIIINTAEITTTTITKFVLPKKMPTNSCTTPCCCSCRPATKCGCSCTGTRSSAAGF